jgi:V/A-type H+-transporting ATPase subunit A
VLDADRARARFYPAVHPLQSYSLEDEALQRWWQKSGCVRWEELRGRFLGLLEDQARLERMARIIGKDAMPDRQRLTLICAELVNESFLRQSAFSRNDRFASPERQAAMMRLLGRFLELADQALEAGVAPEDIAAQPVYRRLLRMGEEIPPEDPRGFTELGETLESSLSALMEPGAPETA